MKIAINNRLIDVTVSEQEEKIPKEAKIAQLKQNLSDTDYIACKIAEGVATKEEYTDILAERQAWRDEINALEEVGCDV